MSSIHAHVATDSRDCDGRQSWSYTITPDEGQDDFDFKASTFGLYLPQPGEGEKVTVEITANGYSFSESTEEGYRAVEVTWCDEDDALTPGTRRDHSAEAAGY